MREYIPKSNYIRPEVYKRIVSVIKDYDTLKIELDGLLKQGKKKYNCLRKKELQRKICAFDKVWENTDDETKKLIQLKFFSGKTYRDMWLPMSEATMRRYVGKFVRELGKELGEID